MKLLIACTGSVATIKLPVLLHEIVGLATIDRPVEIRIVITKHAAHFIKLEEAQLQRFKIYQDADEWACWSERGDPVLHIELAKWADVLLIAPLDANTLAKLANGLCDNLVTCVARAWDFRKPFVVCPAMNTRMWEHPVTAPQLASLQAWGCSIVPCVSKTLICGDTGLGAMAEVPTIVHKIHSLM